MLYGTAVRSFSGKRTPSKSLVTVTHGDFGVGYIHILVLLWLRSLWATPCTRGIVTTTATFCGVNRPLLYTIY